MGMKDEKQDRISAVFRLLGLETTEERERLRLLAHLGRAREEPGSCTHEPADTRNNTARDEDYAQLERTS